MKPVLILTTVGDSAQGKSIAETLVQEGLAACVNVIPQVQSIYRWKGTVVQEGEWLLLIKTTDQNEKQVYNRVGELHSYELPELITITELGVEKRYFQWMKDSVHG